MRRNSYLASMAAVFAAAPQAQRGGSRQATAQEKGGEDETGPYNVVPGWLKPIAPGWIVTGSTGSTAAGFMAFIGRSFVQCTKRACAASEACDPC